jgi:hypothetical protein
MQLGVEQAVDEAAQLVLRKSAQIVAFRGAQELDAERMDEVHVPHLPTVGLSAGVAPP